VGLAVVFTSVYVFFIKKKPDEKTNSVSSSQSTQSATTQTAASSPEQNAIAQNLLSLLLNIKNIKLDDSISIFSDETFQSLNDSSIILISETNGGRPNPFAQFGSDNPATVPSTVTPPSAQVTPSNPLAPPIPVNPGAGAGIKVQ